MSNPWSPLKEPTSKRKGDFMESPVKETLIASADGEERIPPRYPLGYSGYPGSRLLSFLLPANVWERLKQVCPFGRGQLKK